MKFSIVTSSIAIVLAAAESVMAASQTCVVGTLGGECITTSACKSNGGKSTAGHCPGAANSMDYLSLLTIYILIRLLQ
jgi:hypothetical protein